jgi:hypothetical protein
MRLEIHKDRAKLAPTSEGEIVDTQLDDLSNWISWKSHDPSEDGASRGFYSQTVCEANSKPATRSQADYLDDLEQALCDPCPRLDEGIETFCENLAWTLRLLTKALPNTDEKTNGTAYTWEIGNMSQVRSYELAWKACRRLGTQDDFAWKRLSRGAFHQSPQLLQPLAHSGELLFASLPSSSDPSTKVAFIDVKRSIDEEKQASTPNWCQNQVGWQNPLTSDVIYQQGKGKRARVRSCQMHFAEVELTVSPADERVVTKETESSAEPRRRRELFLWALHCPLYLVCEELASSSLVIER